MRTASAICVGVASSSGGTRAPVTYPPSADDLVAAGAVVA